MTDGPGTSRLLEALRRTADALDELGISWALVGGLAVSVRAGPRFTRDIDLAVSVADDATAEALVRDLTARGYHLVLSLEQAALGRLATVRLLPPGEPAEGVVVDLLFASSGIEPDVCREADRLEVTPGLIVPVAQIGHLVAMKILADSPGRPQDAMDLQALVKSMTPTDRAKAFEAIAGIEAAGAHRGKRLRDEADRWLKPPRS